MRIFQPLLLILLFSLSESLNIVFYTYGIAPTHLTFLQSVVKVLIDRGHTVDIVFAMLNNNIKLQNFPGARRNFTFALEDPEMFNSAAKHLQNQFEKPARGWIDIPGFDKLGYDFCEQAAIPNIKLLEFLKSGNYDIGMTNDYDPCGIILLEAAGIPVKAGITPTPLFYYHLRNAGSPSPSSVYGTIDCAEHDGSFYDRVFHFLRSGYNNYVHIPSYYRAYTNLARAKFGSDFPDTYELETTLDVIFVNSHEILEQPRPLSQKIKFIGSVGKSKEEAGESKIPDDLQKILDRPSSRGVVIFSFGTQVPTKRIPIEIRQSFLDAFNKFPDFDFIWKYDNDVENDTLIFSGSSNVHRVSWLPQKELLGHPKTKLFITHMGQNSFLETGKAGIPVLSIPLFVDQHHNAQNSARLGMGIIVDRNKLTRENIEEALNKLLNDEKYGENARKVSKMMMEKPGNADDIFIEWIEFASNNPGLHKIFNPFGIHLHPFYYYSIDVLLFLFFFTIFNCWIIFKIWKWGKKSEKSKIL